MGKKVVGFFLGIGMSAFAVMAYFSGEPASQTSQGHIVILVVFIMGLIMAFSNLVSKSVVPAPAVVPPTPIVPPVSNLPLCPTCHKPVSSEFKVCPYCATVLKPTCPHCGKEVANDFKNCPYCGTQLHHQ